MSAFLQRSTIQKTPLLPEHQAQVSFGVAELDGVVHKPVLESEIPEPTWDQGPGGISLPHPRSTVSYTLSVLTPSHLDNKLHLTRTTNSSTEVLVGHYAACYIVIRQCMSGLVQAV